MSKKKKKKVIPKSLSCFFDDDVVADSRSHIFTYGGYGYRPTTVMCGSNSAYNFIRSDGKHSKVIKDNNQDFIEQNARILWKQREVIQDILKKIIKEIKKENGNMPGVDNKSKKRVKKVMKGPSKASSFLYPHERFYSNESSSRIFVSPALDLLNFFKMAKSKKAFENGPFLILYSSFLSFYKGILIKGDHGYIHKDNALKKSLKKFFKLTLIPAWNLTVLNGRYNTIEDGLRDLQRVIGGTEFNVADMYAANALISLTNVDSFKIEDICDVLKNTMNLCSILADRIDSTNLSSDFSNLAGNLSYISKTASKSDIKSSSDALLRNLKAFSISFNALWRELLPKPDTDEISFDDDATDTDPDTTKDDAPSDIEVGNDISNVENSDSDVADPDENTEDTIIEDYTDRD